MINEFILSTEEISLLDEPRFIANGGLELHFGAIDDRVVQLRAVGTHAAITGLARDIIAHHTAACGRPNRDVIGHCPILATA